MTGRRRRGILTAFQELPQPFKHRIEKTLKSTRGEDESLTFLKLNHS